MAADPSILAGIAGIFVVSVYNGIMTGIAARKKVAQDQAEAEKADLDKKQAEVDRQQIADIKKTGLDTHTLSNSAMGLALRENALAKKTIYLYAKRIADNYSKELADIDAVSLTQAAWLASEKLASKHEGQQETVDASGKA